MNEKIILNKETYDDMLKDLEDYENRMKEMSYLFEIYKKYTIKSLLDNEEYAINNIEEYGVKDFYFRQLLIKFIELGITNISYIENEIKDYLKNDNQTNN